MTTEHDDRPSAVPVGESDTTATIARRSLLGALGIATVGGLTASVLGLTGRAATPLSERVAAISTSAAAAHDASHLTTATGTPSAAPTHADHDAQAEAAVKAFPAKTAGAGLQELKSTVVNGVREFDLTCDKFKWEVTPGTLVDA